MVDESRLEVAARRVREGEAHVARQKEILAELKRDGHPTETAKDILATLEESLSVEREQHAVLMAAEKAGGANK